MKKESQSLAKLSLSAAGEDKPGRTRLLVISDCSERVSRLRAALDSSEVEITDGSAHNRLNRLRRCNFDLAIIDVGLEQIVKILKTLRSKAEYARIHVLVEYSRISTEPAFAGLLPQYRAMACGYPDLIALVKGRTALTSNNQRTRGIL